MKPTRNNSTIISQEADKTIRQQIKEFLPLLGLFIIILFLYVFVTAYTAGAQPYRSLMNPAQSASPKQSVKNQLNQWFAKPRQTLTTTNRQSKPDSVVATQNVTGIDLMLMQVNAPASNQGTAIKPVARSRWGAGLMIYSSGLAMVQMTRLIQAIPDKHGYISLAIGTQKTALSKALPTAALTLGFPIKRYIQVGGIMGITAIDATKYVGNTTDETQLSAVLGVQVSATIRRFDVAGSLLSGKGIGIGFSYFF